MVKTTGIEVVAPKKIWQKTVRHSLKETLSGIVKMAINTGSGKYTAASRDLFDIVFKGEFACSVGEKAWVLVVGALTDALRELVADQTHHLSPAVLDSIDVISDVFADRLGALKYHIEPSFFNQPQHLLSATGIIDDITAWFENIGYSPASAHALSNRFWAYFPFSLQQEWQDKHAFYQPLFAAFSTPFSSLTVQQATKTLYQQFVLKQAHESVFGEAISLKQIYVPLNAWTYTDNEMEQQGNKKKIKQVMALHQTLTDWVMRTNDRLAVRVISGGPGAGKSTFSKIWAAELVDKVSFPVFYIPLHNFRINEDLTPALARFFGEQPDFSALSSLCSEARQMLLIFDGLDELSMQGQQAEMVANHFVEEVMRTLSLKNSSGGQIKAVITGRDLSIQNNEDKWRSEGQVLHILPYYIDVKDYQQKEWNDPEKLLTIDLRNKWWQQYGQIKSLADKTLPDAFKEGQLNEISTQPLLNYLLALSHQQKHIAFDGNTRLDEVYEDLITGVYNRQYGSQHKTTKDITTVESFVCILEEVALAIWHQGGRQASEQSIAAQIETAGLQTLFSKFKDAAKSGVTRLLMAFYFRKGPSVVGDATFEWTHKSFGEYLVARRLVRLLETIHQQMSVNEKHPDKGWTGDQALLEMVQIGGSNEVDRYMISFLESILTGQPPELVRQWQQRLAGFINVIAARRLPMSSLSFKSGEAFDIQCRWSRNCEELIFVLHHRCGQITEKVSAIDWPEHASFKNLFNRIDNIEGNNAFLFRGSVGWLDISDQDLTFLDLSQVNFYKSDLAGADFSFSMCIGTQFIYATLTEATFENAHIYDAQFNRANLVDASFQSSLIESSSFDFADVTGANFQNTNTQSSGFELETVIGLNEAHCLPESWLESANQKKIP
jgi:hypothetical protein